MSAAETTGSIVLSAPEGGPYEFRYYSGGCGSSFVLAATGSVTVRGRSGCSYSLEYDYAVRASPTPVPPGGEITATWVAPEGHDPGDWIGFYAVGAAPENYLGWTRLVGTSGAWVRTVSAVGRYEFRLHRGRTYTEVARSNSVEVGTYPPSPIVVQGRVIVRVKPGTPTLPVRNARVTVSQIGTPGWIGEPATTDELGDYSITLPASALPGSYTIRATLFFSDFYVVNYRYPLAQNPQPNDPPPDADRVSLGSGTNPMLDIYVPQPVILVHGILGSTETWGEAEALLRLDPKLKARTPRGQQPPGWNQNWIWPGPIAHRGYIAKSVSYGPPMQHWNNSHERNAELLNTEIRTFRRDVIGQFIDPAVPIDIVAHSMGGLVTRAYLHHHAQDASVDRVFTFGTPHAGVVYLWHCSEFLGCAFFYQSPGGGCAMLPSPYVPEAFRQMDPLFLNTFNAVMTRTRGARFILIGSDQNRNDCEPELATLPIPLAWDDRFVSTYSSVVSPLFLSVPPLPVLWAHIRPEDHFGLRSNIEPHFILNTVLLEDLERLR